MFDWTIKTEEEAFEEQIDLKEGRYMATVTAIEYKKSKAGNDYLRLKMKVNVRGTIVFCDDNLVDTKKMFFKRKHFWESAGSPHLINATGEKYIGKTVEIDCKVEEYMSEKYSKVMKKLVIVDYVTKESTVESSEFTDDDIPF